MELFTIGIDNGNFNTKSSDHYIHPSGFTSKNTEFITSEMELWYNGKYYAIGDKRMNLQQDKTKTDDTFILTLPSLANCMKQHAVNEAEFILGVGLPMELYGTQKNAFANYFNRGTVEFVFEDENYIAHIKDVKVFPQGFAAICRYYNEFKDLDHISIVDIGGYTVDCMSVTNQHPDKSSCLSLRMGTIDLFTKIKDRLQSELISLPDSLIEKAIRGICNHKQKDLILQVAKEETEKYISSLMDALQERGYDLGLPIVFAGGGAELLQESLVTADINSLGILDRFANADGYKMLLG